MGTVSQRVTNGPLTKSGVLWQKTDFRAKNRPGGRKTGRRAAERPPTRKLKLSRVTSGYGGLKIPLGRIHLTPKNGGYMCENGRNSVARKRKKLPQIGWCQNDRNFGGFAAVHSDFLRFLRFLTFFTFFFRFFHFLRFFYVFLGPRGPGS